MTLAWPIVAAGAGVIVVTVAVRPLLATAIEAATYDDESALVAALWEQSPEVIDARAQAATAASELRKARTLPNPQLDFTWGTIPIGKTNPPDLAGPLGNVPNYSVGLSELIELGKRGPRSAAAAAQAEQARAQALSTVATRFFALLRAIGDIAKHQARAGVLTAQVHAGGTTLELERARAAKGETAAADFERSQLEQMRLVTARDSARTDLEVARAACAAILVSGCPPFPSARAARRYLRHTTAARLPAEWRANLEARRPEVAALDAALRAADEQALLARRKAIPDVTVRVGYTYDTFVASGNQRQSAGVGVQLPLPVFDHGQADLQAAEAALAKARATRRAIGTAARTAFESATRARAVVATRAVRLTSALATARSVRAAMEGAAREGGASQLDVLLARRAHQELLLEGIDIDADGYEAFVKVREATGDFPQPAFSAAAADVQP